MPDYDERGLLGSALHPDSTTRRLNEVIDCIEHHLTSVPNAASYLALRHDGLII